ncbi:hypothetical protein [Asaia bogorensis]|uniref:hypothetical protein n=1 Tax=Asaia bogorensis TaxID=91915 RepID=UPI00285A4148|nr:hypothetical protein [Asaia bogorensis]MDR6182068.1 hypothetical protein [Asaia bogorensis NBRC 16594]
MKRLVALAALLPSLAWAQSSGAQFIPPGGLPASTPVGTGGNSLATMQSGITQNASDIASLTATSVTQAALESSLAPYMTQSQANSTFLPLAGGTLNAASGGGLKLLNPSPQNGASPVVSLDFSAFWNELTLTSTAPGSNLLTLWNKAPNGFTAATFRGYDTDLNSQFEHYAIGYFPGLNIGGLRGYSGMEVSSYDMTSNSHERASPFVHQETGAHFDGTGIDFYGVIPQSAMSTITCPGGCTFPAGINGDIVESQQVYGLYPKNTTIVSGAGTSTLTMSSPANFYSSDTVNGQPLVTGGTGYTQTDWEIEVPTGNVDDFRFVDLHDNTFFNGASPFFSRDRRLGRVGIWTQRPLAELDVQGNAIFGIAGSASDRAKYINLGIINSACQPGSGVRTQVDRNIFLAGSNTLQGLCLSGPARYRWVDLNIGNAGADGTISEQYLDGSRATRIVAHPVTTASASRQLLLTDCGTTITVSGSTALTLNIGTGLAAGCRITVTQLGTGAVTIAALSGETVGWYDTQAETGPYTLAGQYASAVIEAKSSSVATVERAQ